MGFFFFNNLITTNYKTMQTKRLTLEEYRQVNAVWLSNALFEAEIDDIEKFTSMQYLDYLLVYGIDILVVNKIENYILNEFEKFIQSNQIEAMIAKHEIITEHCPH